jgi:hypothetical protein
MKRKEKNSTFTLQVFFLSVFCLFVCFLFHPHLEGNKNFNLIDAEVSPCISGPSLVSIHLLFLTYQGSSFMAFHKPGDASKIFFSRKTDLFLSTEHFFFLFC